MYVCMWVGREGRERPDENHMYDSPLFQIVTTRPLQPTVTYLAFVLLKDRVQVKAIVMTAGHQGLAIRAVTDL